VIVCDEWSIWDFPQLIHFGEVPLSGSATNNLQILVVPYPPTPIGIELEPVVPVWVRFGQAIHIIVVGEYTLLHLGHSQPCGVKSNCDIKLF
jgi:hypothetical protein